MSGSSRKEKLIKLVLHMQSSLFLNTVFIKDQVEITSFSYRPANQHAFQISKSVISQAPRVNIGMSIGYNLTNRFSLLMAEETSITPNKWVAYSLGLSYNIGLKSYGNRILLSLQLALNSISNGVNMGEYSNAETFMAGNRKINSDKIKLFLGERAFGIQPGIIIKKDIFRSLKLFLGADYCWNFNSQRRLFIEESSGFLFRKQTTISLNRPEIAYSTNQTGKENELFDSSFFNFKAGIILGR